MEISQWVQLVLNAAAASVLLNAGIAKFVAPRQLELALVEILPALRGRVNESRFRVGLRGAAAVEILAAAGLLTVATRLAGALATTALGLGFALLGGLGLRHGSSTPCGCLGSSSHSPLGWSSVGLGLALAGVGPLNLLVAGGGPATEYATGAVLFTAIGSIGLSVWAHRRLVAGLLLVRRADTTGSEVR